MDRKQAKAEYKQALTPMGIVRVRNLTNDRSYIVASKNTRGTMNSLRFQLSAGSFPKSEELCRDWKALGEAQFVIEVVDELAPVDDPSHDYAADLRELEALWLQKLEPYGERGYHGAEP